MPSRLRLQAGTERVCRNTCGGTRSAAIGCHSAGRGIEQLCRRQLHSTASADIPHDTPEAVPPMNFRQNTKLDVWHRMPPTKFLLGRKRVEQLVDQAVAGWPTNTLAGCEDTQEISTVGASYAHQLAREQFGSVMVLLFIGLVTALVQVLLEWWLLKPANRIEFAWWQEEMR
jgi:hypothetical protein